MAGGRARAAASKSKASVRTDDLLDSLWAPDSSTMFNGNDQLELPEKFSCFSFNICFLLWVFIFYEQSLFY